MHVDLRLLLQVHPRNGQFRRRVRRLRPVYPDHSNELWYKSELLRIVRLLKASTDKLLLPALKFLPQFAGDAFPTTIRRALDDMARQFGGINATANRLASLVTQRNLAVVDARLARSIRNSVGVDIKSAFTMDGKIRQEMAKALKANVDLITSIPKEYFGKIETAVNESFMSGTRWEGLRSTIEHVGHVTDYRAKLIARDQTSKMNGAFNCVRQTEAGIDSYYWQTAGDERVRDTHAENDGKIFRWDDPPEETGNPGDDINCRCVAIPVLDLDGGES
jgi:SPP1 gp7 family putative phage head morphogenesis protein